MDEVVAIEDERGVDIGQIRRLLRLSVPERVREMVEVANVMLSIRTTAQGSMHAPSR
ncbi:MAG: hypothetical protein M3487_03230 [Actinomycetota bacterium]|nr:hypothetical protein [Acidimicrobiia bacterium]MDQ3468775.1 hypothetical protein [Actinomycetota bacterium]